MKHFKTLFLAVFTLILAGCFTACGTTDDGSDLTDGGSQITGGGANQDGSGGSDEESSVQEQSDETEGKVLIVYFSATGTTKGVATTIHSQIESDIYEIVPMEPYTSEDLNYSNSSCRANQEQNDPDARPEIDGSVENIEEYDTIFLGYPIWWGQAPKIIYTFLESYDFGFAGVTIIPFCTSGGSSIGTSATNLHASAPQANWKTGTRITGTDVSSLISQMD